MHQNINFLNLSRPEANDFTIHFSGTKFLKNESPACIPAEIDLIRNNLATKWVNLFVTETNCTQYASYPNTLWDRVIFDSEE